MGQGPFNTLVRVSATQIIRRYTEEEARTLASEWLSVFGRDRLGLNTKAFMWHVFSAGRSPSIGGDPAEAEYRLQTGVEFVVLSNDRNAAFLTDVRPDTPEWSDCYVFPPNFAWTMAFTHEAGWLGPYFARHRDFTRLDAESQAKLRKVQERAEARAKGWCE